jgi:hypothetical protein
MNAEERRSVAWFRELISVPSEIEVALWRYAGKNPEDAGGIEGILRFRKRVAEECELLLAVSRITPSLETLSCHHFEVSLHPCKSS